ncbi:MAG: FAD-dependent oxidoreductase, partial [Planctomycetota bacterium]
MTATHFDFLVIGAGPAGQHAAVEAAKYGKSVRIVERGDSAGGECVHRGTIPSKTLRETALYLSGIQRRAAGWLREDLAGQVSTVDSLMRRLDQVRTGHEGYLGDQLDRYGINL